MQPAPTPSPEKRATPLDALTLAEHPNDPSNPAEDSMASVKDWQKWLTARLLELARREVGLRQRLQGLTRTLTGLEAPSNTSFEHLGLIEAAVSKRNEGLQALR